MLAFCPEKQRKKHGLYSIYVVLPVSWWDEISFDTEYETKWFSSCLIQGNILMSQGIKCLNVRTARPAGCFLIEPVCCLAAEGDAHLSKDEMFFSGCNISRSVHTHS